MRIYTAMGNKGMNGSEKDEFMQYDGAKIIIPTDIGKQ